MGIVDLVLSCFLHSNLSRHGCSCLYVECLIRSGSQSAEVLRHDEPSLKASSRIPRHGIPVGHQHKSLVEHFLWCFASLAEPDFAHRRDHNAHPPPTLFVLFAFIDGIRSTVLE